MKLCKKYEEDLWVWNYGNEEKIIVFLFFLWLGEFEWWGWEFI